MQSVAPPPPSLRAGKSVLRVAPPSSEAALPGEACETPVAPASNVTPRPPPPPENNKRKADLEDPSVVVTKEPRTEAAAVLEGAKGSKLRPAGVVAPVEAPAAAAGKQAGSILGFFGRRDS